MSECECAMKRRVRAHRVLVLGRSTCQWAREMRRTARRRRRSIDSGCSLDISSYASARGRLSLRPGAASCQEGARGGGRETACRGEPGRHAAERANATGRSSRCPRAACQCPKGSHRRNLHAVLVLDVKFTAAWVKLIQCCQNRARIQFLNKIHG